MTAMPGWQNRILIEELTLTFLTLDEAKKKIGSLRGKKSKGELILAQRKEDE